MHDYGEAPGIGNFSGMQTLTRVPETAKAADVSLDLRIQSDVMSTLEVGTCEVYENRSWKSIHKHCRVGIENYSRSVEVNATGNRYKKEFNVLGYIDDLGL